MKRLFTCIFLLSAITIARNTYAQIKTPALQGKIISESGFAAEAVTIALLRYRDSSYVKSAVTNSKGIFQFGDLKPAQYILLITKTGYHKIYAGPYLVLRGKATTVDSVRLSVARVNLEEVVILNKRRYIEVRPDKTILNVDGNIMATGTSVLNVLNNAPGIKINSNGDVGLRSGQRAAIFVNGRPVKLEGADLNAYLQGFPSADVDQIELIPNPTVKYDAAGTGGVINIILKKGKYEGFNGSVTSSAGTGKYHDDNVSFTANYREKKFNIFGGAGYKYTSTDRTINTLRNVNAAKITTFDTHYYNTQRTPSLTYQLGTDFFIDPKHTLGFLIKGSTETSRFDKQTHTTMVLNGIDDSTVTTLSNLKRKREMVAYNLNYSGTLGHSKQTLSVDADYLVFNRHISEDIISKAVSDRPHITQTKIPHFDNDTLTNIAPTRYTNKSLKVDYVAPLNKTAKLEVGVKASYEKNDNTQTFDVLTGGTSVPDPTLTSRFIYTEKLSSAYLNFSNSGKKFSYTTGLRAEHIISDANTPYSDHEVKRDYTQFFPAVQFSYNFKQSQLSFDYNRRILPPKYEDLNPIISYQDNYNYRSGNAYLKPDYADRLQLSYTGKTKYLIALYLQSESDFWNFSYFYQDDASKLLMATKVNLKRANNYGVTFNLPVMPTKWWDINFNADLSYWHFKDYSGNLNKGGKDFILTFDQGFRLTQTLSIGSHVIYESPNYYGITSLRPTYLLNMAISQQLFANTASITLSGNDIFDTFKYRYSSFYKNLDIQASDKSATRIFRLSFVYRFGKKSVKAARRHITGNDEEQKRMNTNN